MISGKKYFIAGPRYFKYKGEWLNDIRLRMIKDIKMPFKMVGGERVDDTPVHKALREALANCLINADYHGVRGGVIRKDLIRIELSYHFLS